MYNLTNTDKTTPYDILVKLGPFRGITGGRKVMISGKGN